MRYMQLILAAAAMMMGCRKTIETRNIEGGGAHVLGDCAVALTGCDGGDHQDTTQDVGHLTKEQVEALAAQNRAEQKQHRAAAASNLAHAQDFQDWFTKKFGTSLEAAFGSQAYYQKVLGALPEFRTFLQEKYGRNGSFMNDFARDCRDFLEKEAVAAGQTVTIERVDIVTVDGDAVVSSDSTTNSTQTTITASAMPGGVGGSTSIQNGTAGTSGKAVTHKGLESQVRMTVTYRTPDGPSISQAPFFLAGDGPAMGHHDILIAQQDKLDAEARQRARAAAQAKYAAYLTWKAVTVRYVFSPLKGAFVVETPEVTAAYDFLDHAWRASATLAASNLANSAAALSVALTELAAKQARAYAAVATAKAVVAADAPAPAALSAARDVLKAAAADACSQPQVAAWRDALRSELVRAYDLNDHAGRSIAAIQVLQTAADASALLKADAAFTDGLAATLGAAEGNDVDPALCQTVYRLFDGLALKTASMILAGATAELKTLLEQLNADIAADRLLIAAVNLAKERRDEAAGLAGQLKQASARDQLETAVSTAAVITARLEALKQESAAADPKDTATKAANGEAIALLTNGLAAWSAYRAQVSAWTMIALRSKPARTGLASLQAALAAQPEGPARDTLWRTWLGILASEGAQVTGACFDTGARFTPDCWVLNLPAEAETDATLVAFDHRLSGIERAIVRMKTALLPAPPS